QLDFAFMGSNRTKVIVGNAPATDEPKTDFSTGNRWLVFDHLSVCAATKSKVNEPSTSFDRNRLVSPLGLTRHSTDDIANSARRRPVRCSLQTRRMPPHDSDEATPGSQRAI